MKEYIRTDKLIDALNRRYIIQFDIMRARLKFDELHIMKLVKSLYDQLLEETIEFYIALVRTEYAEETDTVLEMMEAEAFVNNLLTTANPVTEYIFDNEFHRKADKLIEALLAKYEDKDSIIDHHMKWLGRQMSQGALTVKDAILVKAYEDLGVKRVVWVTAEDEKVCEECRRLDGMSFGIKEIPSKPHFNCRCIVIPEEE